MFGVIFVGCYYSVFIGCFYKGIVLGFISSFSVLFSDFVGFLLADEIFLF